MKFETPLRLKGKLTSIMFTIRPIKEDGILIYSDKDGIVDSIAVSLKNGYVEFR